MTEPRTASTPAASPASGRLLTGDDLMGYVKSGWYRSGVILPPELLDSCRRTILARQPELCRRDPPVAAPAGPCQRDPAQGLRREDLGALHYDIMRMIAALPAIGAIAAQLARGPVGFSCDQPLGSASVASVSCRMVGWHTDHSFWSGCAATRMVTAWIPFEETSLQSGTLCVVDGSHRWPETTRLRGISAPHLSSIEARLGRRIPTSQITAVALRKGEVAFHHMRLLHSSPVHRVTAPQLMLAVHLHVPEQRLPPVKAPSERFLAPSGSRSGSRAGRRHSARLSELNGPDIHPNPSIS